MAGVHSRRGSPKAGTTVHCIAGTCIVEHISLLLGEHLCILNFFWVQSLFTIERFHCTIVKSIGFVRRDAFSAIPHACLSAAQNRPPDLSFGVCEPQRWKEAIMRNDLVI